MSNTTSLLALLVNKQFNGFPAIELVQLINSDECKHTWSDALSTFEGRAKIALIDGEILAQCDILVSNDQESIPHTIFISGMNKVELEKMEQLVAEYQEGRIDDVTCCNIMVMS